MHTTPETPRVRYAFGQYVFAPHSGELNDSTKTFQLRPQVAKLLDLLLRNAGETVSREDIKNHLWGSNIVVEFEEGISACVRQLRIALNDGADGTRYIQTISRRGYKFVFPVSLVGEGAAAHEHAAPAHAPAAAAVPAVPAPPAGPRRHVQQYAIALALTAVVLAALVGLLRYRNASLFGEGEGRRVVAVLPFTNLSQSQDNTLLGASVANEVISLLGPIAPDRMGVIASTSSAHFQKGGSTIRDIGQELGADYVLEGSITQQGRSTHLSARLISTADQNYVWGDEYDLDPNYSGSAYRQLTIRIATQVAALLAPDAARKPSEFTGNRDAAVAFQLGRYQITQGETDKAYANCQKAAALDAKFAAAYACAARALLRTPGLSKAQLGNAQSLVGKALALDAGNSEAHLLKGELDLFYDWDLASAGDELKDSLRYNPGDAWAWQMQAMYQVAMGQTAAMQNAMDTARALDAASVNAGDNLALVSYLAGDYARAETSARTNASLNTQDSLAQHILTLSLSAEGKYAEALKQASAEMQAGQASAADIAAVQGGSHGSLVSYFKWYAARLAAKPTGPYAAVFLADAYMHLGQPDQAYAALSSTVKQHGVSSLIPFMSVWPSLRPLCSRADFLGLTKQLGQPGCMAQ